MCELKLINKMGVSQTGVKGWFCLNLHKITNYLPFTGKPAQVNGYSPVSLKENGCDNKGAHS